ncbi:two-component sensor histidine kinase [Longispora fulva]|uniref:histidine kinase n=1 Tax=Longispora fulva TaxID=619741 RepID=A0A8J7KLD5_9ACTN|nr:sensor histidine kinase [Longispora fulva]MBG6139219.1 signal transduction histidine kinase [Longispora fulva]GIG58713.1 two-component sensor histidine kinase [Longispora fulva]
MPRTYFGLPLRSAVFDAAVVLGALLLCVAGLGSDNFGVAQFLLGTVMCLALLFRRRYATIACTVVALLALFQTMMDWQVLPHDVAVLVAGYSVVKYSKRLWEGFAAGGALLIGVVLAVNDTEQNWEEKGSMGVALGSLVAGVWFAGLNARNRRLYVVSLEDRAETLEREQAHLARIAVGEERNRIARELHDIVAHSLAVMIVQADGARYVMDANPEKAREAMRTIGDTGRESLEEMRRLVGVLREAPDEDRNVVVLNQVETLVERSEAAGLLIEMTHVGQPRGLPQALELTAYRIVQEALTNTLKHAGAGTRVTLTFEWLPHTLNIAIVDDGGGQVPRPVGSGGHGLVGMRERAMLYGGELIAKPRLVGGFEVFATLPLRP